MNGHQAILPLPVGLHATMLPCHRLLERHAYSGQIKLSEIHPTHRGKLKDLDDIYIATKSSCQKWTPESSIL